MRKVDQINSRKRALKRRRRRIEPMAPDAAKSPAPDRRGYAAAGLMGMIFQNTAALRQLQGAQRHATAMEKAKKIANATRKQS